MPRIKPRIKIIQAITVNILAIILLLDITLNSLVFIAAFIDSSSSSVKEIGSFLYFRKHFKVESYSVNGYSEYSSFCIISNLSIVTLTFSLLSVIQISSPTFTLVEDLTVKFKVLLPVCP